MGPGSGHSKRSGSSRAWKFINLDPLVFTWSDPNKDPQDFIEQLQSTLGVMHATVTEVVELASYGLKDVAML